MKSYSFIFLIFAFILLLFSCKKKNEEQAIQPQVILPWQKFIGDYLVFDKDNNFIYAMSISHFKKTNQNGVTDDSLVLVNFANRFYYKTSFGHYSDDRILNIGIQEPIFDYYGKRWLVSDLIDTISPKPANTLINDTIILYYFISNCSYYQQDSISQFTMTYKQIAIKQNN